MPSHDDVFYLTQILKVHASSMDSTYTKESIDEVWSSN